MNELKRLWQTISPRERMIVTAGISGVLLILLYSLVWVPWHDQLGRLRDQVPGKRDTLAWMEQAAREAAPLLKKREENRSNENLPILTVLERSATDLQLRDAIKQMRPADNNEVQVSLQDADFNTWLRWIDGLRKQGIVVRAAAAGRTQEPGMASIRMTLGRE